MDIEELESGNVSVKIRSKRGTETRDQDEVTIEAVFENLEDAEAHSDRVNDLVKERLSSAREFGNDDLPDESTGSEESKVYFGDGSNLQSWIPLQREVIFQEIAPLVSNNSVEEKETPGIKMNFTSDIPISGWQEVDADVVLNEIEPIVEKHRLDRT